MPKARSRPSKSIRDRAIADQGNEGTPITRSRNCYALQTHRRSSATTRCHRTTPGRLVRISAPSFRRTRRYHTRRAQPINRYGTRYKQTHPQVLTLSRLTQIPSSSEHCPRRCCVVIAKPRKSGEAQRRVHCHCSVLGRLTARRARPRRATPRWYPATRCHPVRRSGACPGHFCGRETIRAMRCSHRAIPIQRPCRTAVPP